MLRIATLGPLPVNVTRIGLERFKKIREATVDLSPINILVGGNNSGKSSFLEGIHFSVVAAVAARVADTRTFTQESLLFCPTREFVQLRNGAPYRNQSNFGYLRVYAEDGDDELTSSVKIYRGRNEGNVGCEVTGSIALRQVISDSRRPFSVYVPGLSGIPQVEECRTEWIIRRGVASGDANLYLRNVLLLIRQRNLMEELISATKSLFPNIFIAVSFDPASDLYIDVRVSLEGPHGRRTPLELVGTGVQQALQIFSYVVLFRPFLLLLDEPDSHLHPDNQGLLAKAMLTIATESDTTIIATTHSRHLVDALYDESNIVWLRDGAVHQQGENIGRIPLLMDIGALDTFERLREGTARWALLSEDASLDLIVALMGASGFDMSDVVVYSYKSASNFQSALLLAEFIKEIAPETRVVIHRDRDFMTDEEVNWTAVKVEAAGAIPFVTEGADIEQYFIEPAHLAELLGVTPQDIVDWLTEIAREHHNQLLHKFTRKRDDIKSMYRSRDRDPPETVDLLGDDNPLPPDRRLGKFMLSWVRAGMAQRFGKSIDVRTPTAHLVSRSLRNVLALRDQRRGAR